MTRIVNSIFVQNQSLRERCKLDQAMPVGIIARKTRHFQSQHDAGVTVGHLSYQVLKAVSFLSAGPGHTEIVIDDVNTLDWPAE
ncbi:hypothetical protein AWB68_08737 [Caballeronia choica]|uniref:Uncharacterized protein n=1 Tax=Caballeronia choica TaxID=326476 RepID=A0A158L4J0_9BURK|nr:hypothetical protein AWB68_08737 [Caballeronia choica]